jgi:hypothetical protein
VEVDYAGMREYIAEEIRPLDREKMLRELKQKTTWNPCRWPGAIEEV